MTGVVYQLSSRKHGGVYIGKTCDFKRRQEQHRRQPSSGGGWNARMQRVFGKDRPDDLVFSVLEEVSDAAALHLAERKWIRDTDCLNTIGKARPTAGPEKDKHMDKHMDKQVNITAAKSLVDSVKRVAATRGQTIASLTRILWQGEVGRQQADEQLARIASRPRERKAGR